MHLDGGGHICVQVCSLSDAILARPIAVELYHYE